MFTYIFGWAFVLPIVHCIFDVQPVEVHLSYGKSAQEMIVTWTTCNFTSSSVVEYGLSSQNLNYSTTGEVAVKFVDGGPQKRTIYIHTVTLMSLNSGQKYYYHVGSTLGWSNVYFFTAMPIKTDFSPVLAVFADMGSDDAMSLPMLQEETQKGNIDMIFHAGDFAYDMDKENGKVGDAFMRQIQPIAAYVPYMTCVGNHEAAYNFSHYRYRFSMPTDEKLQTYYSFNIGKAHIIAIDTEVYYYDQYGMSSSRAESIKKQYQWLVKDLQNANSRENRSKHPWLIVMGHRPMYCSNNDGQTEHCNNLYNNRVRTGIREELAPGFEDLFYKYGVDVQFYAHEHSYERLLPVYNLTVCKGVKDAYTDPGAPVHIISGSGGNNEGQTKFDPTVYPWSGFHTDDYGYTRMKIINSTHIHFEQVSINKGGSVVDAMMLIKSKHGAGLYTCH